MSACQMRLTSASQSYVEAQYNSPTVTQRLGWLSQYSDQATCWSTGFEFRARGWNSLFTTGSRPALGTTRSPTQHLLPRSPEVRNAWSCLTTPPYVFMV